MRLSLSVALVCSGAMLIAAPVAGQKPDSQILPRSIALQHQAESQVALGHLAEADDALETALAVDPRNRGAFVDLARVAEKQKLFGKAIRLTSKALLLEPNDIDALAVQGEAMVELGAVPRAQANLTKLQKLCPSGCPAVTNLSSVISRGPAVASAKPPADPKTN